MGFQATIWTTSLNACASLGLPGKQTSTRGRRKASHRRRSVAMVRHGTTSYVPISCQPATLAMSQRSGSSCFLLSSLVWRWILVASLNNPFSRLLKVVRLEGSHIPHWSPICVNRQTISGVQRSLSTCPCRSLITPSSRTTVFGMEQILTSVVKATCLPLSLHLHQRLGLLTQTAELGASSSVPLADILASLNHLHHKVDSQTRRIDRQTRRIDMVA